jgi:predicted RNA-binding protein YlxR (DUF448 family)
MPEPAHRLRPTAERDGASAAKPRRSCVACRQVRAKRELLRVVRTPAGHIEVDVSGKLAGRGAYLCRDHTCLNQALKQRKLDRALGAAISAEVGEALKEQVASVAGPGPAGQRQVADEGA